MKYPVNTILCLNSDIFCYAMEDFELRVNPAERVVTRPDNLEKTLKVDFNFTRERNQSYNTYREYIKPSIYEQVRVLSIYSANRHYLTSDICWSFSPLNMKYDFCPVTCVADGRLLTGTVLPMDYGKISDDSLIKVVCTCENDSQASIYTFPIGRLFTHRTE